MKFFSNDPDDGLDSSSSLTLQGSPSLPEDARPSLRLFPPEASEKSATSPGPVQDGLNRRLICVGLEEFGSAAVETEETTVKTWASLRRAGSQVEALARSFRRLGYGCTVLDGRTSA